MLISQSIPSLIGGVSQVPPTLRSPACCEIADNCFLSTTDGLVKRPPSNYLGFLSTFGSSREALTHFIDRDGSNRYVLYFDGWGKVLAADLNTGVQIPVYYDGSAINISSSPHWSYMACDGSQSARKSLRVTTLGDVTLIANTEKVTGLTSTVFPGGTTVYQALIWVKSSNFNQSYVININGALAATYTTAATGSIGTDLIATNLGTSFGTHGISGGSWNVQQAGSFIVVTGVAPFTIEALDSAGGTSLSVIKDSVTTFSQLPPSGYDGLVIKVTGDLTSTTTANTYYVQFFKAGTSALSIGTWQECPAPGTKTTIDPATMPRQITRLVDTTGAVTGTVGTVYLNITNATWNHRTAGDTTNCPDPSFVGKAINDVFYFDNRLGFLTDTTVVLSEAGNFTNFFRTTALQLLDTDPIDVSSAHPRVVKLRSTASWQQSLVIFGDRVQFIFGSPDGGGVTPSNVQMVAATEYECDPICRPVPVQNLLYFPFNNSGYVGVREYYVEYYTQKKVAKPITDQVPKYIPGNCKKLITSAATEVMGVLCDGDPAAIYVYKWQWNGNSLYSSDKSESAWVRWDFGSHAGTGDSQVTTNIVGAAFFGQTLYVVLSRTLYVNANEAQQQTNYYIESVQVDSSPSDLGTLTEGLDKYTPVPFTIHLDRRVQSTSSGVIAAYNATTNQTTYTVTNIVYSPAALKVLQFVTQDQFSNVLMGNTAPLVTLNPITPVSVTQSLTNTTIVLPGDTRGLGLWFGEAYTMRYRFSPFLIRQPNDGQPRPPDLSGRLQIRTLTIRTNYTGYYRVEINPSYRAMNTVTFTGQTLGSYRTPLGNVGGMQESQQLRCLIGARNDNLQIDLVNDSPMPSRFCSAEWEGNFYARSRKV